MRVLLVNPPFYRFLGSHYNANSLGIAYIASTLNKNGHDAWLYNADFVNETTYKKLKGIFEGFIDYKTYFQSHKTTVIQSFLSAQKQKMCSRIRSDLKKD